MEEAPLRRRAVSFATQAPPPQTEREIQHIKEEEPEPDYESEPESSYYPEPAAYEPDPIPPKFTTPRPKTMQQRAFNKMEDEYSRAARVFPERFGRQSVSDPDVTRQELIDRSRNTKKPTTYSDYARYVLYGAAVAAFGFLAYKGVSQARARAAYEEALRQESVRQSPRREMQQEDE